MGLPVVTPKHQLFPAPDSVRPKNLHTIANCIQKFVSAYIENENEDEKCMSVSNWHII